MKIAMCPGHYPSRPGASYEGLVEHYQCKLIVEHAVQELESLGHDVAVFEGTIREKVERINAGWFDLAFDIHLNAGGGQGCEVLYYPESPIYVSDEPLNPRREPAARLSRSIALQLRQKNRGPKPGWWWGRTKDGKPLYKDGFLRLTKCRSYIIEPGFIDDMEFAQHYLMGGRHDKIGIAIARAIDGEVAG